jgi:hypothetical protein
MNWQFLPRIPGACEATSGTETRSTPSIPANNPDSLEPPCLVVRVLELSLIAPEKQGLNRKKLRQLDLRNPQDTVIMR